MFQLWKKNVKNYVYQKNKIEAPKNKIEAPIIVGKEEKIDIRNDEESQIDYNPEKNILSSTFLAFKYLFLMGLRVIGVFTVISGVYSFFQGGRDSIFVMLAGTNPPWSFNPFSVIGIVMGFIMIFFEKIFLNKNK